MAYKTADLEKKALVAIKKHNLYFIEDVVAYLPCDKVTFYNHKLNEFNTIKSALEKNRVDVKVSMRSKWYKSENPTLQMGLYKLIGTDAEAHRLNGSKQEIKHEGGIELKLEINKDYADKIKDLGKKP